MAVCSLHGNPTPTTKNRRVNLERFHVLYSTLGTVLQWRLGFDIVVCSLRGEVQSEENQGSSLRSFVCFAL